MTGTLRKTLVPFVVGANHRSSVLSLRDRLFVEDVMVPAFLKRLSEQGVGETLLLSTCDRVEVQGVHENPESIVSIIHEAFARHAEMPVEELADQLYSLFEDDALRHIMRVASSLDSQVIGGTTPAFQLFFYLCFNLLVTNAPQTNRLPAPVTGMV